MKARVNPFTREVILDNGREELSVQFSELDEQCPVTFEDGSMYEVSFLYDDVFQLTAHELDESGFLMENNVITKINIEY